MRFFNYAYFSLNFAASKTQFYNSATEKHWSRPGANLQEIRCKEDEFLF